MALTYREENLVLHSPAKGINSDLLIVTPAEFALAEVKVAGRWQHYQRLLYAHQIHSLRLRDPELFRNLATRLIVISREADLKKFPTPSGILDVQDESVKEHRILMKYSLDLLAKHEDPVGSTLDYQVTHASADQKAASSSAECARASISSAPAVTNNGTDLTS